MKRSELLPALLLLAGLFSASARSQEGKPPKPSKPPKGQEEESERSAVTRFFEGEAERLTEGLEGSWMMMDYTDPSTPLHSGVASGFLTFHEGFMTWIISVDTAEVTFLGLRAFLMLDAGAYRYHVDEQANLQLSSVMSFTNDTPEGDLQRERNGFAFEYFTRLEDEVLELRDPNGIVMSFRKVRAGEFPESATRGIEKRRARTPSWDDGDR